MAAARRLSELLQEQQEPFLVEAARGRRPRRGRGSSASGAAAAAAAAAGGGGTGCCPAVACRRLLRLCNHGIKKRSSPGGVASGLRSALSKVLGSRAMRRVLRWDDLGGGAGCFSGASACGSREFRRLRRRCLGDSSECEALAPEKPPPPPPPRGQQRVRPSRHGVSRGRWGGGGGADGVEGRHERRLIAPAQPGLRPRPALRRRRRVRRDTHFPGPRVAADAVQDPHVRRPARAAASHRHAHVLPCQERPGGAAGAGTTTWSSQLDPAGTPPPPQTLSSPVPGAPSDDAVPR